MQFPSDFTGVHFHFVGIKGTGMAALVELLYARKAVITGSDVEEKFYTDAILEKLGIKVLPFSEKNITDDVDVVIYSSAYNPEKNPDLIQAKKKNIPLFLYSEALGALSRTSFSCGICGVHGKTTTTGFTGTLLKELPLSSQVLAGSVISSFGSSCVMSSANFLETKNVHPDFFAAETCEYQRHFMAFSTSKIILTSVESDHQDYYPTYNDIRNAFVDYICLLPQGGSLIYCADDAGACETASIAAKKRPDIKMIPYGKSADGIFKITFGEVKSGAQYFSAGGFNSLCIRVPGEHNVRNATAALALVCGLLTEKGLSPSDYEDELRHGLESFAGGKRRSEILSRKKLSSGKEVIFIDDYGHHPTAIKTTLEGYRNFYSGHKIIVDFMSHTYSRTQALLEEFASSFGAADCVIINRIYASARENAEGFSVSGKILAEHASKYHKNVIYADGFDEAALKGLELLKEDSGSEYPDGYLFVTMGAGDNWKVADILINKL